MRRGGTTRVIDETTLGVPMLKQKCLLVSPHGTLYKDKGESARQRNAALRERFLTLGYSRMA